jgi:hypothetical protein
MYKRFEAAASQADDVDALTKPASPTRARNGSASGLTQTSVTAFSDRDENVSILAGDRLFRGSLGLASGHRTAA